jgi:hypothetical protein
LRTRQNGRAGETDEQPMLDNTWDCAQKARQTRGILYAAEVGVDNPVAAIGDKNVAIPGLSHRHLPGYAAFRGRLDNGAPRKPERDDLDGQREASTNVPVGKLY